MKFKWNFRDSNSYLEILSEAPLAKIWAEIWEKFEQKLFSKFYEIFSRILSMISLCCEDKWEVFEKKFERNWWEVKWKFAVNLIEIWGKFERNSIKIYAKFTENLSKNFHPIKNAWLRLWKNRKYTHTYTFSSEW